MAARSHRGGARRGGRSGVLLGPCGRLGRRPLDHPGGDRGGGAGGCALGRALHAVSVAAGAYVRGENPLRDAQRLRRTSGTESVSVSDIAAVVVMGVSGAGKSTVGKLIAARLDCPFRDADSFHPKANIAKRSRGEPLTDTDRWPWLEAIAAWIAEHRAAGTTCVVTCSALKRRYRDLVTDNQRADV